MYKIIAAGFGGQGVMSLGQLMAYSAMLAGKQVSWMPAYGPEMRGGTANCSVIISDEAVAAPIISRPNILVAFNKPSLSKFVDRVEKDGFIFVNSSLIDIKVERLDVKTYYVPANELAIQCGTIKAANVIMLGAVNKACNILTHELIYEGLKYSFKAKPHLVDANIKTYHFGYDYIK